MAFILFVLLSVVFTAIHVRGCNPAAPGGNVETITATVNAYPLLSWLYAASGVHADISMNQFVAMGAIKSTVTTVMREALNTAGIDANRVVSVSSTIPATQIPTGNCVVVLGISAVKLCTGGQQGNLATCGSNPTGCTDYSITGNFEAKIKGKLTEREKTLLQTGIYQMLFSNGILISGAPTITFQ